MSASKASLGDLLVLSGQHRGGKNDYPVLSITMKQGLVDQADKFKKRVASQDTSNYRVAYRNELVVGFPIDEGVLGFQTKYPAAIVSPAYDIWRLKNEADCHIPYLERYLRSAQARHLYASRMQGAVARRRSLTKADFLQLEIPFPSLDDQTRIAHLLGKVEGLIAQRKQQLQQLDDLLKSVFLEMFGDPVRNEKGWTTEQLGDIALIERGRFSPRPRNDPRFYGGEYPFIQTGDITRSKGRLKEYTQTLNELGIKVSKEFNVGTIVIAIVGATIGETAVLVIPTYAPDSVIGITPKGTDANENVFIEYVLRFWKPVLRAKAPEAARANINIETLRPLPIVMPPNRAKFSEAVVKVEALKMAYQNSLADLENLYGAMSQKAFKGELDLSRVPLPDNADPQALQTAIPTAEVPNPIDLPDTELLLAALDDRNRLKELLPFWLEAYRTHLNGAALSAQTFLAAAQTRIAELHPDNDFELGADAYDQVKAWVFEALASGRLTQGYADADNRVTLAATAVQV